MYFLHNVIISVSTKKTQIWMSLHIITLGKAGLAASVWDVIVQITSSGKGLRWLFWLRMPSHRMQDVGSYLCHWETLSFKSPANRNKSTGIRKQMQILCWNLMRPRALYCRLRPWTKLWTGWEVPCGAWMHFYMARCLLKGKLRHYSTGGIALYTLQLTRLYPLPLYI